MGLSSLKDGLEPLVHNLSLSLSLFSLLPSLHRRCSSLSLRAFGSIHRFGSLFSNFRFHGRRAHALFALRVEDRSLNRVRIQTSPDFTSGNDRPRQIAREDWKRFYRSKRAANRPERRVTIRASLLLFSFLPFFP